MKPGPIRRLRLVVVPGLVILICALLGLSLRAWGSPQTALALDTIPQTTVTPPDTPSPPATDGEATGGLFTDLGIGELKPVTVFLIVAVAFLLFGVVVAVLWVLMRRRRRTAAPAVRPAAQKPGGRGTAQLVATVAEPSLILVKATGESHPIPLDPQGLTIGRAEDNDLVIGEQVPGWETVSHHHARISEDGGRWIVEDLGSLNGVFVNGRRTGRNLLKNGWTVGIGGVVFTFRAGAEEAAR